MPDELFNSDPVLARVFRQPSSDYANRYDEFEQCFEYLRHQSASQARRIEEKTGISQILVDTGYGEVCLGNDQDIKSWFRTILTAEEDRFVESLKVLNRRLGKLSFAELLSNALIGDREVLRQYVTVVAWQRAKGRLWEWVMLLALMSGLRRVIQAQSTVVRLGPKAPPVSISLRSHDLYLWYQRRFQAYQSGLAATPDLMLTLDSVEPDENTIHAIIECKHTRRIESDVVRSLWATAEDVQTAYAVLASFEPVSWSIKNGAWRLGLEVLENPIADLKRILSESSAVDLFGELSEQLEKIEDEKSFDKSRQERQRLIEEKRRRWQ